MQRGTPAALPSVLAQLDFFYQSKSGLALRVAHTEPVGPHTRSYTSSAGPRRGCEGPAPRSSHCLGGEATLMRGQDEAAVKRGKAAPWKQGEQQWGSPSSDLRSPTLTSASVIEVHVQVVKHLWLEHIHSVREFWLATQHLLLWLTDSRVTNNSLFMFDEDQQKLLKNNSNAHTHICVHVYKTIQIGNWYQIKNNACRY